MTLEERIEALSPLTDQKEVQDIYEKLQWQDVKSPLVKLARDKGIL